MRTVRCEHVIVPPVQIVQSIYVVVAVISCHDGVNIVAFIVIMVEIVNI